MVYNFFVKMSPGSSVNTHANKSVFNDEKLAEELRKPIIKFFFKRPVQSGFEDNIWGADLADMQLINKFNKGFRFLSCAINTFSKYVLVVPLEDKKGITITNDFQNLKF